jgi:acid phosphatase (class A)
VHWQSDIESGRLIGAATVARLHANPVFNAQLEAARGEFVQVRAEGGMPKHDCAAETAALAAASTLAP